MSFLCTSFWLECKRRLFTRATLALLLLAAVLGGGCGWLLSPAQQVLDIAIGLVYEPGDPYTAAISRQLSAYQSVRFVPFSPTQLEDVSLQVADGTLECAYVFPADLQASIAARKTTDLVSVIKSPNSVADTLVSEWVFSAVLRAGAADIVIGELSRIPQLAGIDFADTVRASIAGWLLDEQYVTVSAEWAEGTPADSLSPSPGAVRPLHGIAALMVLLTALSALPSFIDERGRLCANLTTWQVLRYYSGACAASLLRGLLAGAASLGASSLFSPSLLGGQPVRELAALALFCLAVACLQLAFIALLPKKFPVFPVGAALILLCILAGGTLLDPSELGAGAVLLSRFLPTSYYLQHVLTGRPAPVLLFVSAASILAAFVLFIVISKHKPRYL